jgi:hypothetical protein
MFSSTETDLQNGLDPYRYLTWVFQQTAPNLDHADLDAVQSLCLGMHQKNAKSNIPLKINFGPAL